MKARTSGEQLRFLSLFAGIGGLDLGFERAGMRCVGQVEVDDFCRAVLAKHWPDVPRFGDVAGVGSDELAGLGRIDVIAGGFPCQPSSTAGARKGTADDRWLWPEFARIVRLARPRWVVAENVPGLRSVDGGDAFGEVVGDLAALGYCVRWTSFTAAEVGAPHLRERVWIVAHAGRAGPMADAQCLGRHGIAGTSGHRTDRNDCGRRQAAGLVEPGGAGPVADTDGGWSPCPQRHGEPRAGQQPPLGRDADRRPVGDPDEQRRDRGAGQLGTGRRGEPAYPGGPTEPGLGGDPDGLPAWVDGHRWPAPRDEAQHDWEPPRTALGVRNRGRRVKALGNAVVPQCAEWIGRRIAAVEALA